MRRAFAVLGLGVALAAGVTACGGSGSGSGSSSTTSSTPTVAATPKSNYEQAMQVLGQQLSAVSDSVAGANNSRTASGAPLPAKTEAANLKVDQDSLRSAAVKLAKIVPPAKVKAAHALLLKGLRAYAEELTPVIARLKKGEDPLVVLPSILQLSGLKDMRTASLEIAKAGFDIQGTGAGTSGG